MGERADFSIEEGSGGGDTIVTTGPLLVSTVGTLDKELRRIETGLSRIDISASPDMDTVGAWVVWRLARDNGAEIVGASEQAATLIQAVKSAESSAEVHPPRDWVLHRVPEEVGQIVVSWGKGAINLLSFLGAVLIGLGTVLIKWRRFPGRALVRQLELVGVDALFIIGLMSFLIGIVIAQQGAVQLEQFGAEALTVNLVGRITLRELGVLMTAIMVAGRSGSAFAAQIGTMKLTEEIDAMRTIGVSPIEVLVVPRVLAAIVMMPLLGLFSAAIAIIGGAVIGDLTLGIPFLTFLTRIQEVVPEYDLWVGLVKAPVFGLIVALAGCYQGMQVRGNAEEVGLRTTKAVVQAIFAVIVLDAFFAVFFTEIGWV